MNFMKKFSIVDEKGGVEISGRVGALLLLAFDLSAGPWGLASLSYSLVRLVEGFL